MYTLISPTPAGALTCLVEDDHTVRAAGFTDRVEALSTRLALDVPPPAGGADGPVASAIDRWLGGDAHAIAGIELRQPGTAFQQQVWAALRDIPPGQTATYGGLAAGIGRPGATRAVGSACGRNLIAPFVPCHRALRSDGTLGGYLYGRDVKGWLLRHERGQI